jgi:hypothetical protein
VTVNAGLVLVQLRYATGLTSEDYVTRQAWREASLPQCPLHPRGGCRFARHGTYARKRPSGTRIARWYCPQGHCTFSLLPDHLAAGFPGTLAEIEEAVHRAEQARSLEVAADALRREDITLPSAIRWLRRRVRLVHTLLQVVIGMWPALFLGCPPRVGAVRALLGHEAVLRALRAIAQPNLSALPRPLGFRPPPPERGEPDRRHQHDPGPDPPTRQR